ncbi:MAG: flagellar export chaperone FliS [Bdellovibrionales bacterium CG10_big_fil_rev_8_21_14_0_10_45_34]|nr:MAG: flagellar export chaperone FliS [Bdellovibrionales bacterium CG10_big_fil_rev_8_21_14_0_10_45_34]
MSGKAAFNKYKQTSVLSASREKLLLMLYDGAIKFLKRAIVAAEEKKIAERATYIGKVYDIILELNNSLDHKVGGEVALQLEQLYNFMTEQLGKANVSGESEPLKNVLRVLETLNEGWVQAVEEIKTQGKSEIVFENKRSGEK